MLYCKSCNNTHWTRLPRLKPLALLLLKREYKCVKCGKVVLAHIFMDTGERRMQSVYCPDCKSLASRARRYGFERLWFFIRAYRCPTCKRRFRKFQITG